MLNDDRPMARELNTKKWDDGVEIEIGNVRMIDMDWRDGSECRAIVFINLDDAKRLKTKLNAMDI